MGPVRPYSYSYGHVFSFWLLMPDRAITSSLLILTLSSSPCSYSLHCSKQLMTLLHLAYILFMVTVRVQVGLQDSHLDNSNNMNLEGQQ